MTCLVALCLLHVGIEAAGLKAATSFAGHPDAAIHRVIDSLSNLAMKEEILRYTDAAGESRPLDSLEAEVLIANGTEEYSGVRSGERTYRRISEIHGLWSVGELVTMLRTTRDILGNSREVFPQRADDSTVIWFQATADDNLWFIMVGRRVFWVDFSGALRISNRTGELMSLRWTSAAGPPGSGVAGISWEVNFEPTTVSGHTEILPARSIYRVVRAGRRGFAEWNQTRYTVLGRYGSTSSVTFSDQNPAGSPD